MDGDHRAILDRLHLLSGQQFEILCAELFEALGYTVARTPASGDRGIDLRLEKAGRTVLVQCKRQQSAIGEPVVRDFLGVVTHAGADKGIFCTNGSFSTRAESWAAGTRIELLDGAELVKLWQEYAVEVGLPQPRESATEVDRIMGDEAARPLSRSAREANAEGESKRVIKGRENAERKWVEARCESLGIPRPTPDEYWSVDGDYRKRLCVIRDGRGEYVVVHDGSILFHSTIRRGVGSALEYFDRIKNDY